MKKKILVTGGAGYIGSHTVVQLFNSGYIPVIVDNLSNSSKVNLDGINKILNTNINWYNIDCTNFKDLNNVFKLEQNISGCIHFAAYKSVSESMKYPKKYFNNNIGSLNILLKCMKKYNVDNLIFSSSCAVYGTTDKSPVKENFPFNLPESPYGATKQECERILKKNSCNSISLRYFNPIGAHSSLLIGDFSIYKTTNLVPIICEVASGLRKEVIVHGDDYETLDGSCIRDFVHVQDVAISHVLSLDYLFQSKGYKKEFNVGSGIGYSVIEIIKAFEKTNDIKIKYKIGNRRAGDIAKIFSSVDYIKKQIGWQSILSLEQALQDSWKWQCKSIL